MKAKQLLGAVLVTACVLSCQKEPLPGDLNENERPGGSGRDTSVVYVTGIGYPAGYDWRKGNYNDVECYLLVFADGRKYLKLPVGDKYHLSPYPDMHRFLNGRLYSDYSTGSETIISENGKELFRYQGREMMSGFLVKGEDVYTLGTDRDGKGFSFRKNGDLLFSDREAVPVGEMGKCLYEDKGDLGFVFRKKYGSSHTGLGPWYVYHHGRAEIIRQSEEVSAIHAARMVDGRLCTVVSVYGGSPYPVMKWGEESMTVNSSFRSNEIAVCHLSVRDGFIYLKMKNRKGLMAKHILWSTVANDFLYEGLLPVYDFAFEGRGCAFLVHSQNYTGIYRFPSGEHEQLPGRYHIADPACLSLEDGILRVGLSFRDYDKHPVLWTDGVSRELPFSGYITSVTVESWKY